MQRGKIEADQLTTVEASALLVCVYLCVFVCLCRVSAVFTDACRVVDTDNGSRCVTDRRCTVMLT